MSSHRVPRPSGHVKVAPVYAYVDVLQVWFKRPPSPNRIKWLSGQCGWPLIEPPYRIDEPPWWNPSYRQGLRLTQPSEAALNWLADRDNTLLTYGELAFDFISAELSQALAEIFSAHFVQRWHRSRQTQLFENGNGRTGARGRVGTAFQWYADYESKVTGEVDCFHFEAEIQGSTTLRRLGINHPRDLFRFDYSAFILRHLEGAFFECNAERLGRYIANKRDGTKRRAPLIHECRNGFRFNMDATTGHAALRALGIQGVVDWLGRGRYLHSLLCSCENNDHSDGQPMSGPTPAQKQNRRRHHQLAVYLQSLTNAEFCFPIRPKPQPLQAETPNYRGHTAS